MHRKIIPGVFIKRTFFVILDGAADHGRQTPFDAAKKPNIDALATNGLCGIWTGAKAPKGYNPKSMSDVATLELLGYSYKDNPGRGFLEALGAGMNPKKDAVYFRGNFSTVRKAKKGLITIDRRAGREENGLGVLAKSLCMKIEGVKITCKHSVGHRCVVVLEGKGLGKNVTETDSKNSPKKSVAKDAASGKTAAIINEFSKRAHEILEKHPMNRKRKHKANYVMLRGASRMKVAKKFSRMFGIRACSIAGVGIIKGISSYVGIDFIPVRGATGHLNTSLESKLSAAKRAIKKYRLVILHINGCDEAGHDRNFMAKKNFIEKIDRIVISRLARIKDANIVITSDHQTSVLTGNHMFGPVPMLLHGDIIKGKSCKKIRKFSEKECKKGFVTGNVMKKTVSVFGKNIPA